MYHERAGEPHKRNTPEGCAAGFSFSMPPRF
nr:MAG TPA: hypothetical protein [Caudoviricetes sp.]